MTTKRTPRFQIVLALMALAALVLPMLGTGVTAQAQAKKVLHYDGGGEPDTIDPSIGSFTSDVAYNHAMFATLLRYDHNNNPSPYLAKEVPTVENGDISKDGKTYTFKLRTDWKWSDGNGVVKAQDVVYAMQRFWDPKNASQYGGFLDPYVAGGADITSGKVKDLNTLGVKAIDDATVQFTLIKPTPYFTQIACLWFVTALRKDNVERAGLPDPTGWTDPANGPVVGTGPLILSKWDHNKTMVFVRNPNYGGTLAKLDEIDVEQIQDAAVAYAGFKSGEEDIASFPTAEYPNIKADPTLSTQLLSYPLSCSFYYTMNNTKPPFNNKQVREAFTYAFDRDQYIKVISQGLAFKQLYFLPKGVFGYSADASGYDFDAAKAKAALAAAGFPDGKGFPAVNFNYVAGANGQRRADYIIAQYKKILNVDLVENPMDSAVYQAADSEPINKIDGMQYLGWCSDYLHASDWMMPVFGSGGKTGNSTNVSGFADPAYEKAATAADNELDQTKALADYQAAQKVLIDDFPVIFVDNSLSVSLVNPKVSGLNANSLDGGFPGSFFWEEVDLAS